MAFGQRIPPHQIATGATAKLSARGLSRNRRRSTLSRGDCERVYTGLDARPAEPASSAPWFCFKTGMSMLPASAAFKVLPGRRS
jgi:hypothetical protein